MPTEDIKKEEPTQEDLLKAVADVLDEALAEYDKLSKSGQGIDYAQAMPDHKGDGPHAHSPDGSTGEGSGAADNSGAGAMTKEDDEDEEDDKDKDKDSDEKLMETYKSLVAKMASRGIDVSKTEVAKSETAEIESLRKSYDEKLEVMQKAMSAIKDSVEKIAAQPAAPRKGVAGYKPLRKSENGDEAPSLKKSQVVERLLELKKSGDSRLDGASGSSLINRVETNRLQKHDLETIKAILGN